MLSINIQNNFLLPRHHQLTQGDGGFCRFPGQYFLRVVDNTFSLLNVYWVDWLYVPIYRLFDGLYDTDRFRPSLWLWAGHAHSPTRGDFGGILSRGQPNHCWTQMYVFFDAPNRISTWVGMVRVSRIGMRWHHQSTIFGNFSSRPQDHRAGGLPRRERWGHRKLSYLCERSIGVERNMDEAQKVYDQPFPEQIAGWKCSLTDLWIGHLPNLTSLFSWLTNYCPILRQTSSPSNAKQTNHRECENLLKHEGFLSRMFIATETLAVETSL